MRWPRRASTPRRPTGRSVQYLDAVAKQAADPVVAKYTGVLAAADVYTQDHAFTMVESLRIDKGILGPFSTHP